MKNKGFTLIELLVVVSIISLLSSVIFASLNTARAKARDAKRITDLRNLSTVLNLYYDKHGNMPPNLVPGTQVCEFVTNTAEYVQTMQLFVDDGFISANPKSPGTQSYTPGYCYYNYGNGNSIGGLMVTALETAQGSATGVSPSCRPWPPNTNWCDQTPGSTYYCICTPY